MKTKEGLNALKNELRDLNAKLSKLSEDEMKEVFGGINTDLEVSPDKSDIGTVSDENTPPPDIHSRSLN